MARLRTINPQAALDEDVATMTIWGRLLWAYLPCHADRLGRLKDSAFTLKAAVFPADNVDVEGLLCELAERRHIIRYEVGGRKFIQIRSFLAHQHPHKNESESTIPPAPGDSLGIVEPPAEDTREISRAQQVLALPAPADPDPDPDPNADLDRDTEGSPQASDKPSELWSAYDWRRKYGIAWCEKYGGTAIGGDVMADGKLVAKLEGLDFRERIKAQARAPDMFAEFLAEEGEAANARHRWSWFVGRFDALRVPRPAERSGLVPRLMPA